MRALFIPTYYDGLSRQSGSARIRAEWVARAWDGAEVYDGSSRLAGYDVYVFQKAYLSDQVRRWIFGLAEWRDRVGVPLLMAFDLCDPDFLYEEHRRRMFKVLPKFDIAVAPTTPLVKWLKQYLPAYLVQDHVDLSEVNGKKAYTDTRRPSLVWFGYSHNAVTLEGVRGVIEQFGLDLTIVAEQMPSAWEEQARFVKWDRFGVYDELLRHDVVLNPRLEGDPWRYKSDNKSVTACALGLPVATNAVDIVKFMDPEVRREVGTERRRFVCMTRTIDHAVEEWEQSIADFWGKS